MEGTPTTDTTAGGGQPYSEPPRRTDPGTERPAPPGGGGLAESRMWLSDKGLVRPRRGRVIAGVCAGLARRYGMPVFLVRVLMVAAGIAGFGLVAYVVFWVLMPKEG